MAAFYESYDRTSKFATEVKDDPKNPGLKILVIKGFTTLNLTFTPDQIAQIGKATGGASNEHEPF